MDEFPGWIGQYVGLEFKDKGRDHDGVDCWGLVRLILKEQWDIELPSYAEYYKTTYDREELHRLFQGKDGPWLGPWREITNERAGDVTLLRVVGHPIHVGVVVKEGWMIHVRKGVNAALESYRESEWNRRLLGIYRHASMS